jgi:hypothetical protein
MLWYKSLREIRMVTLTGASAMAATCALFVLNQQAIRSHAHGSMPYLAYIWKVVYDGSCQDIFIALCIILGSGGLLQEKAHGTAGFTLAFPGSRRRIVFTPALVGYFGIVAIASVPVLVVPIASRQVGEPYPVEQCLGFFILWTSCGAVFYGLTFFFAHRIEGDYIAFLLAVPSLILYDAIMDLPWLSKLRMLNLFDILNGEEMSFLDDAWHLVADHLPWSALAVILIIGSALIVVSARRIQAVDFKERILCLGTKPGAKAVCTFLSAQRSSLSCVSSTPSSTRTSTRGSCRIIHRSTITFNIFTGQSSMEQRVCPCSFAVLCSGSVASSGIGIRTRSSLRLRFLSAASK